MRANALLPGRVRIVWFVAVAAALLTGCFVFSFDGHERDNPRDPGASTFACGAVDLQTDRANCGVCGQACTANASCIRGSCVPGGCVPGVDSCGQGKTCRGPEPGVPGKELSRCEAIAKGDCPAGQSFCHDRCVSGTCESYFCNLPAPPILCGPEAPFGREGPTYSCGVCLGDTECMIQRRGCEDSGYRDPKSGLVWRFLDGSSMPADAARQCAALDDKTSNAPDWRLPTRAEVQSLVASCGGETDACTGSTTGCLPPKMQEELKAKDQCRLAITGDPLGNVWVAGSTPAITTFESGGSVTLTAYPTRIRYAAVFCLAPSL